MYIYIYIYIYIYQERLIEACAIRREMCVCVCVYICKCKNTQNIYIYIYQERLIEACTIRNEKHSKECFKKLQQLVRCCIYIYISGVRKETQGVCICIYMRASKSCSNWCVAFQALGVAKVLLTCC